MDRSPAAQTPPAHTARDGDITGRAGAPDDVLEACQRAVSRVLAELPERDRKAVEEHEARVVELTHWDTRAALAEIRGILDQVA